MALLTVISSVEIAKHSHEKLGQVQNCCINIISKEPHVIIGHHMKSSVVLGNKADGHWAKLDGRRMNISTRGI